MGAFGCPIDNIPHKVSAIPFVDELSPEAQIIGVINIVANNDDVLCGDNTDGKGFLQSLTDRDISVAGKTITVLGAGGASRAICVVCDVIFSDPNSHFLRKAAQRDAITINGLGMFVNQGQKMGLHGFIR